MAGTESSQLVAGVPVSDERFVSVLDGSGRVDLCFQAFGAPADEAVLLIMGLGGPMTWWHPDFCALLAGKGFYVIRFDNRDTGRSTKLDQYPVRRRDVLRALGGRSARAPYPLLRMADDGAAVLDHLGIASAHVCGISMGGMIAQTLAVQRPDRVRSLVSIMSSTGSRLVGWQDPTLIPAFIAPRGSSRDAYLRASTQFWTKISSPDYPESAERARDRAGATYDRGFSQAGVIRQLLAVLTQPDRTRDLRRVRVPSAVVHGLRDRMVHVSGGRATARAIPGCELVLIPGMGHDVPRALYDQLTEVIRRTAGRAAESGGRPSSVGP